MIFFSKKRFFLIFICKNTNYENKYTINYTEKFKKNLKKF
jgi:hypothetical protein